MKTLRTMIPPKQITLYRKNAEYTGGVNRIQWIFPYVNCSAYEFDCIDQCVANQSNSIVGYTTSSTKVTTSTANDTSRYYHFHLDGETVKIKLRNESTGRVYLTPYLMTAKRDVPQDVYTSLGNMFYQDVQIDANINAVSEANTINTEQLIMEPSWTLGMAHTVHRYFRFKKLKTRELMGGEEVKFAHKKMPNKRIQMEDLYPSQQNHVLINRGQQFMMFRVEGLIAEDATNQSGTAGYSNTHIDIVFEKTNYLAFGTSTITNSMELVWRSTIR